MNGIVIAGTNSGCGKTTITLGLLALLQKAGHGVAPFKVGPDFIDPVFHQKAAGKVSYNLDSFLLDPEVLTHLFCKHCGDRDLAVVEGVMGLFDGMGSKALGSTAEVSKILGLPVILVVSCKSLYQSVAAIVTGYTMFDRKVNIAGVILNHVHGIDGYGFLKEYVEMNTGVPCIGYLPNCPEASLESRHLGLVQANEVEGLSSAIVNLRDRMEETVDVSRLVGIAATARVPQITEKVALPWKRDLHGLQLAVACDKAFQFYYQDNLELLQDNGAELLFFSPLSDGHLPANTTALYLGGGYPEVFARELSANRSMLNDVNKAARKGMPIFAECGGLMYLTAGIVDKNNERHAMAGVFLCEARMTERLQRFGYCNVRYKEVNTKAHEFHHSCLQWNGMEPDNERHFEIGKPEQERQWKCGLRHGNVLAGYPHFHFWSEPLFYHKIMDLWMQTTL